MNNLNLDPQFAGTEKTNNRIKDCYCQGFGDYWNFTDKNCRSCMKLLSDRIEGAKKRLERQPRSKFLKELLTSLENFFGKETRI